MAKRRRKASTTVRRRRRRAVAANPRRRRHSRRRRRNPSVFVARTTHRRHHRRRRHSGRRRNPSTLRIGQVVKDMAYGAGGAILTRAGAQLVSGFVPGVFAGSAFIEPVLQAGVATFVVRPLVGRFLGKPQGEIAMLGGLISAGLSLADKYVPGIQNQLTNFVRAPVAVAPGGVTPVQGAGMGDVYDVDLQAAGFGALGSFMDVEDVTMDQFD